MEAVPRLQMLSFALKTSPEGTSFSNLKRVIAECYQEDAESYSKEVYNLESLRNTAMRPEKDMHGCKVLKRYYSQLHALVNRFPHIVDFNLFTFHWKDLNVSNVIETTDIRFEMASVLFNIGCLHTEVGATTPRTDVEGMKIACTHFQCAAWAFGELKEKFKNVNLNTDFMTPELLVFMQQISFAQAQECILEKSLIDNRKPIIVARVTAQIINYYSTALVVLLSGGDDGFVFSQVIENNLLKLWKKYVKFKISYLSSILYLYQGQNSEEQQKMGERVALYQAAVDKLEEARKESKGLPNQKEIAEALIFTADVVEGKRKNAKNENEFIYHEAVPEFSDITAVQGANLVNGTGFSITDPDIFGEDIFARLVPMKAHEASSLYSEEKAKILRNIGNKVEEKDNELSVFMSSLNIENLNISDEQANKIPQGIVDRCALLNAKTSAIPDLISSMSNLAEICVDVETNLRDIRETLDEEESKEKQYQQSTGVHRANTHFTELTREFQKYLEAHQKAGDSNDTLRKAMELHVNNLKILSKPLQEIQQSIPKLSGQLNDGMFKELKLILNKVNEMKAQRAQFHADLRIAINSDDITSKVIAHGPNDLKELFQKELGKHDQIVKLIEQNLTAQANILTALTDAYAKCAPSLKTMSDVKLKKENFFSSLAASYDVYEDLLAKSAKGLEFYKKLQGNIQKLLTRVKAARDVQEEDRKQRIKSTTLNNKTNIDLPHSVINSGSTMKDVGNAPKLKDYLKDHNTNMKNYAAYPKISDTSNLNYIPSIRPNPLGSENPAAAACIKTTAGITIPSNHATYTAVGPMDPPPPYSPLPPTVSNSNYDSLGYVNPIYQNSSANHPNNSYLSAAVFQQNLSAQQYQNNYNNVQNQRMQQSISQPPQQVKQQSFQNTSLANQNLPANAIHNYPSPGNLTLQQQQQQQQLLYQQQQIQNSQTPYSTYQTNLLTQNASPVTLLTNQMKNINIQPEQQQQIPNPYYQQSGIPSQYNLQSTPTQILQKSEQMQTPPNLQQQQISSQIQQQEPQKNQQPGNYQQVSDQNLSQTQYHNIQLQNQIQQNRNPIVQQNPNQIVQPNLQQQNSVKLQQQHNTQEGGQLYAQQLMQQNNNNYVGQQNQINATNMQQQQYLNQMTTQSQQQQQSLSQANQQKSQQQPTQSQQQFFHYNQQTNSLAPSQQTPAFGSHPGYSFNQSSGQYQYGSGFQYASNNPGLMQYTNSTANFQDNKNINTTDVNQLSVSSEIGQNYDKQYSLITNQKSNGQNVNYPQQQLQQQQQQSIYANNTYQQPLPPFSSGMSQYQQDHLQPMVPNLTPLTYVQSNNNNTTQTTTSSEGLPKTNIPPGQITNQPTKPVVSKAKTKQIRSKFDLLTDTNDNSTIPVIPGSVLQPLVAKATTIEDNLNSMTDSNNISAVTGGCDTDSVHSSDGKNSESKKIVSQSPLVPSTSPPALQQQQQLSLSNDIPIFLSSNRKYSCDNISIHSDLSSLDHNFDWDSMSIQSNDMVGGSATTSNNFNTKSTSLSSNQQQLKPSTDPFEDSKILKYFHKEVEHYEKCIDSLGIKMLNGNTPLFNKWKDLQDLLQKDETKRSASIAKLFPEKNRTPDSIPYDHARVVLERSTDDYINAAYVKDLGPGCPVMILAQTPLQNTTNDFWSMIWKHKVRTVVCLHTPNEILDTFWPQNNDKELHFDDYSIQFVKQNDLSHCIEYNLKLTMNGADAIISLSLLQIKSWSKNNPTHILEIARNMLTTHEQRNHEFNSNSPLIMNCLTGSERSGLVSLGICAILSTKTRRPTLIDVVDIWYRICSQRKNALKDANNLELSMKIVLCHAHNVLNQRGIMTSYQMKLAQTAAATEKEEVKDPLRELDPLWKLKNEK